MADARFEDGAERPVQIKAFDGDDLVIVSALTQDAIFPVSEMKWAQSHRRFAILLNRFRWEDKDAATTRGRDVERVQSVLAFEDVLAVKTQGVSKSDKDMILSLMAITFEPGEDGTGRIILTLSGDGAIALDVEALEASLKDVTRPYVAPSGKTPNHPD